MGSYSDRDGTEERLLCDTTWRVCACVRVHVCMCVPCCVCGCVRASGWGQGASTGRRLR